MYVPEHVAMSEPDVQDLLTHHGARIEAKAKLSQNRPARDVDGVVRATAGTPMSQAVQAARPDR